MKPLGGLLIFFGIASLIFSMQMDTSVEVKYPGGSSFGMPERVNNIGWSWKNLKLSRSRFIVRTVRA